MKAGLTMEEFAAEIERQQKAKRDFIVPTRQLVMAPVYDEKDHGYEAGRVTLGFETTEEGMAQFGVNGHCHEQVATRMKIPMQYYRRMLADAPDLLTQNVNEWLRRSDDQRMVRTLDGNARAFLSDRYRCLDNFDLASAILPVLGDRNLRIESCDVTDRSMYIKAINPRVQGEVKVGDVVQAGVAIRNSEIGSGALAVEPLLFRLSCLNGMISADRTMKKYHVGRGAGGGEENAWEIFRDETRQISDQAVWHQVRDLTEASLDEALFGRQLARLQEAAAERITGDPVKAVEVVQRNLRLTEDERGGVLRHLIEGGDLSRWGMVNAVTRASQDAKDYDRATDMERMGGSILELPQTDWQKIAAN